MADENSSSWHWLETWNPTVYLFAGIMAVSYAVLKGLKAYAGLEVITVFDVLWGGFVLLIPVFALLGLNPRLRDGAPRLARGAAIVTALAGIGIVAIQLQMIVTTVSVEGYPEIPGDGPAWPVVALILVFITLALGFLLSGVAARRTDDLSGTVAGLLVVPFLGWVGLIIANVVLPSGDYLGLFAYAPIGVALLAIGYLLRTEDMSPEPKESLTDSTA